MAAVAVVVGALLLPTPGLGQGDPASAPAEAGATQADTAPKLSTEQLCERVTALVEADQIAEAEKALTSALAGSTEPLPACVDEGLADVAEAKENRLCDQATTLKDSEQDEKAAELFGQALAVDPTTDCSGLTLTESKSFGDVVGDVAGVLTNIAAALLAIAGLVAAVLFVVGLLSGLRRFTLQLKDFSDPPGGTGIGVALAAFVRAYLRRREQKARENSEPSLQMALVSPDADPAAGLSALGDIGTEFKMLAALANAATRLVYPERRLTATGAVHAAGGRGYGLTLGLERDAELATATTVWGRPPPPPGAPVATVPADAYTELCAPAAAWIEFELARTWGHNLQLPSSVAESYVELRAGIDKQIAGDREAAAAHYEAALVHDSCNLEARNNLAFLELRAGDVDTALRRLRQARDLMERDVC